MRSRGEPDLLGAGAGEKAGLHHRLAHHRAGRKRLGARRVLIHQARQELLVERAPVDADPDGLRIFDRHLDDGTELPVALLAEPDIARIDAVLVERLGAGRMVGEELVADIVEVADERDLDPHLGEPVADVRDGGRRLVAVDGDADQLRAGAGERGDLGCRRVHVRRVGIGHRLDDDRRAAAHDDAADIDADGFPAGERRGGNRLGFRQAVEVHRRLGLDPEQVAKGT